METPWECLGSTVLVDSASPVDSLNRRSDAKMRSLYVI